MTKKINKIQYTANMNLVVLI